jgi:hypothetical protein
MKDRNQLIKKISNLEKQMLLKLEEIRDTYEHKGIKGTEVEKHFRSFLKYYLPRRHDVGEGEIIDRNFNTSNQTDIIITDENHPFSFGEDGLGLFFIEGVCAAGEIKSVLTTEELTSSLDKAYNYKKMTMIPPAGAIMNANDSDGKRFYTTPPFFIFAFESQISIKKAYKVVSDYKKKEYSPGFSADGIFILNRGYMLDMGDGLGAFYVKGKDGKRMKGWTALLSDKILFDFLSWLSSVMPRMQGGSNILVPYLIDIKKKVL